MSTNSENIKEAFLASFDAYSDALFRFCMVKTRNKEISEDLVQETFMRYWQALRQGKEMPNTRSFLYTIANNIIIDWYRKKKSDSLDRKMADGYQPRNKSEMDTVMSAEHAEVLHMLERLEESDREVLLLRYVEGLEPKEIAESLGVSANVVSVRINRATKRLKKELRV